MNGRARRLARLEERMPPPPTGGTEDGPGARVLERIAGLADRIHAAGRSSEDDPDESPLVRCVLAATGDAAGVAEWGTPAWGARFWRRVVRYAFAVRAATHHDGEATVHAGLPAIIQEMRAFCEAEERGSVGA